MRSRQRLMTPHVGCDSAPRGPEPFWGLLCNAEALLHREWVQRFLLPSCSVLSGLIPLWSSPRYLSTGAGDTFTPRPVSRNLKALPAHSPLGSGSSFGVCGWLRLTSLNLVFCRSVEWTRALSRPAMAPRSTLFCC